MTEPSLTPALAWPTHSWLAWPTHSWLAWPTHSWLAWPTNPWLAWPLDPALVLIARVGLALLFASAAWHKLRDRDTFVSALAAYRVVPDRIVAPAATAVAASEVAVAMALLLPAARGAGALGAAALLAVYSLAIAVNLARGRREIDCGCGGTSARQPIAEWLLVRNALLAMVAAVTLQPVSARSLLWVDWLTVAGGVAVAACVWTAAHGLAAAAARVPVVDRELAVPRDASPLGRRTHAARGHAR